MARKKLSPQKSLKLVNFSDFQLSPSQVSLLLKGPTYCPENVLNPSLFYLDVQKFIRRINLQNYFSTLPSDRREESLILPQSHFNPKNDKNITLNFFTKGIADSALDLIKIRDGVESEIAKTSRHFAKRAPNSLYSANLSGKPSKPCVIFSPSELSNGVKP